MNVHRSPDGFILLAVLWVTALLSMFALNYATSARVSSMAVTMGRDLTAERLLLRSALELGRHEYLKFRANQGLLEDRDLVEWITDSPLELLSPRHEPYHVLMDGRPMLVWITAATGRLDVNQVPPELLARILEVCGLEPEQRRTEVVNALQDWIDEDDLHRAEGAESDYYLGLDPPYLAKNNRLQSIEELLLVKGVDAALFHGGDGYPGLVDFLDVSGNTAQFDVNNVSPGVFALVEGLAEEIVEDIVRLRQERAILSMEELAAVVPQELFGPFSELFGLVPATAVRIRAALVHEDGRVGRVAEILLDEA